MKGWLFVDGTDTYGAYGVWITKGGYDGLLSFPALVEPEKNVWPEEDGIEVDLENPTLQGKEVSIPFVASDPGKSAYDFIHMLSEPGYHVLRVPSLGREWRLRLLSHPNNEEWGTLTSFTLRFSEDMPVRPVDAGATGCGVAVPRSDYGIDGAPLDRFGVVVEKGLDGILRSPAVKENLTRSFSTLDGKVYDTGAVVFQAKDVTLQCVMMADSMARFWACYDSFFHRLIRPGERALYCDCTGEEYPCHYKGTSGWRLASLAGRVVVEFSLTLVFTAFRIGEMEYLLASEEGELIETEDGFLIDLKDYAN